MHLNICLSRWPENMFSYITYLCVSIDENTIATFHNLYALCCLYKHANFALFQPISQSVLECEYLLNSKTFLFFCICPVYFSRMPVSDDPQPLGANAVSAETFLKKVYSPITEWKSRTEIAFHDPGESETAKVPFFFSAITLKPQQNPENTRLEVWESLQCVLPALIGLFGGGSWRSEDFFLSGEKGSKGRQFSGKIKIKLYEGIWRCS